MALLEVFRRIVGKPDLSLRVLPSQRLEREVDRDAGGRNHERRTAFGIAEDEQLRGAHLEADLGGFAAVIDERENIDSVFFEKRLQAGEVSGTE